MTVLVVYSESHPLDVETFRAAMEGYEVRELELPAGGQHVEATEELSAALADCRAVMVRSGAITREVLEAAPNLEVIAVPGSGCDHIDLKAATDHGVVVVHNPDAHYLGVIEHTFMLLFALMRSFPEKAEMVARGEWLDAREPVKQLSHQTLGVVGLGTIGFEVARTVATTFDATVVGYDPYVAGEKTSKIYPRHDRETVEDAGIELASLAGTFERADAVTVHVPLSEETRHLVGGEELDLLEGGCLVNTSRGPVVDEDALIDAVDAGTLAGVGLDVMDGEPPADDNPLLSADEVIVTPHVAGVTEGYLGRAAEASASKIKTVFAGERPGWVVNPDVFEM